MPMEKPPICDYEGSDYQQTFWDSGQRIYEDRVEAIALRRLLPHSGEILLEIGAGAGRNTPRYRGISQNCFIRLFGFSIAACSKAFGKRRKLYLCSW